MRAAAVLFRRELDLTWGGGGGPLVAVGFLAVLTTLIPLAGSADPNRLAPLAAAIAWVALALASLLSLERLFERDHEDGALDLLAVGPLPVEAVCAIKALAHWLGTGLPLALAAPVTGLALGLEPQLTSLVLIVGLIGGLGFSFTGALGAALAIGARRGGLLIALIVLPLFIPPVIFGGGALAQAAQGQSPLQALVLLGAYTLFAVALGPLACAAGVRNVQG